MQDRHETYQRESKRENHQTQASQDFLKLLGGFHTGFLRTASTVRVGSNRVNGTKIQGDQYCCQINRRASCA